MASTMGGHLPILKNLLPDRLGLEAGWHCRRKEKLTTCPHPARVGALWSRCKPPMWSARGSLLLDTCEAELLVLRRSAGVSPKNTRVHAVLKCSGGMTMERKEKKPKGTAESDCYDVLLTG